MATPTRTYERKVSVPAKETFDWDQLERLDARIRRHATETGWIKASTEITVYDTSGSFDAKSVAEARSMAESSAHKIRWVSYRTAEESNRPQPSRRVSSLALGAPAYDELTVSGPYEAEVLGLTAVLDELVKAPPPAPPRHPDDSEPLASSADGRWWDAWWFVYVVLALVVGVVASLIANAIWGIF